MGLHEKFERSVNRAYWGDGLLDLFTGLGLALIGLAWLGGQVTLGAIAPALLVPMWAPARRRFTTPRLGHVELGDRTQQRHLGFTKTMVGVGIFVLLTVLVGGVSIGARAWVAAMPGTIVAGLATMTGIALRLVRFLTYAAVLVLAAVTVALLDVNPGWAFVVGGCTALVAGVVLIVRFAKLHPHRKA